jgi:hypothetical protein
MDSTGPPQVGFVWVCPPAAGKFFGFVWVCFTGIKSSELLLYLFVI